MCNCHREFFWQGEGLGLSGSGHAPGVATMGAFIHVLGLAHGLLQCLQNALKMGQFGALGGGGHRAFLGLSLPGNALGRRAL